MEVRLLNFTPLWVCSNAIRTCWQSLDIAKYCLPESYKTELSWSINARSLQNFLSLRSSKSALWEIRDLANLIHQNLPDEHKFIYENCLTKPE